jgi:hypothetical protein
MQQYIVAWILNMQECKFQLPCNNLDESGKIQITFRKVKDHNGMVRTNHCELHKYKFVGCVCKALDNH